MSKLVIVGTVAFDAIETPFGKTDKIIGGAATYIALAASYFTKPINMVSVVGDDFPKENHNILSKYLDLQGLAINKGKTFRYDGKYDNTLSTRSTLKTELNVLENFKPVVPDEYKKSQFVFQYMCC